MADRPGVIVSAGVQTFVAVEPVDASQISTLRTLLGANGGRIASSEGGRVVSAFEDAGTAARSIVHLPTTLRAVAGTEAAGELRVAVHTGDGWSRPNGDFGGPAVRRVVRLVEAADRGHVLVSSAAAPDIARSLPAGWSLVDLGVHRLRDLSPPTRIFGLTLDGGSPSAALGSSLDVPNNLPLQPTPLVGRERELTDVAALLQAGRLLTLTGVGGSGKSRLAGQAAADVSERWPDGAWWVDLAETRDSPDVAVAVATTLDVLIEPGLGPLRSLISQLRDRRILVVLDNCEQVLDDVADVAQRLLLECPDVTVLATSREPLGVPGETVWHVPPLDEEDALALLVERALLARPAFTLDAADEATVRAMCLELDGIPLAVELAAAWLRTLTPQEILAGLHDRLALLVKGPRGVAPRHRTLASSIDWSHRLLDETDRVVFRRLATFRGTFGLAAARDVSGGAGVASAEIVNSIGRLVDKSLVTVVDSDRTRRYRLLETIRQYATEKLVDAGELEVSQDRHLEHFLGLAEEIAPEPGPDMDAWRLRLEREHDNLRAALDRGLERRDPELGRRLAAALSWMWHFNRSGYEGIEYLRRAIERAPDERSHLQARLLTGIALVADTASPLDLELDAAQEALAIAVEIADDRLRALGLTLAAVGQFYTDFDAALNLTSEAETLGERVGSAFVVDASRALRGIILHLGDRHAEAAPYLVSAVEGLVLRHRGIAATTLAFDALGLLDTGDLEGSRAKAQRAVEVAAPLGDHLRVGSTRSVLALVCGLAGDVAGGFRVVDPVVRLDAALDGGVFVPGLGRTMGSLHLLAGDPAQAVPWFERDTRAAAAGAETWLTAQSLPGLAAAFAALGRLDDAQAALKQAKVLAGRLGMPGVLAGAAEQEGCIAEALGDLDRAANLHHEALATRDSHGLRTSSFDSLDSLAVLASTAGRGEEAIRVLAASSAGRRAIGYPRTPTAQARHEATVAAISESLGEGPVAAAWEAGSAMTLDEVIAYVRRARGARRRPTTGWASLTTTELEVVQLVAEGMTNPEIGARLFMSRGTVKTHLSHVYAKLLVGNRTELATLAAAHREPRLSVGDGGPPTRQPGRCSVVPAA